MPPSPDFTLVSTHPKYATQLRQVIMKNRDHLSQFLPWPDQMGTEEKCREYLEHSAAAMARGEEDSYLIISQEQLAGRIGLHYLSAANRSAAIGYWLAKEATGRGIILSACRQLIQGGFSRLGLNRIELKAAKENFRSVAIAGKLGFTYEGLLREAEYVAPRFLDLKVFSMLKKDWPYGLQ